MKKLIILILSALALTFLLSGCGGGDSSGPAPGSLTVTFRFLMRSTTGGPDTPISNLSLGYAEPGTTNEIITMASNSDGEITKTLTKSGQYTILKIYYPNLTTSFNVGKSIDVSTNDVTNGNHTALHIIVVESTGATYRIYSIDGQIQP